MPRRRARTVPAAVVAAATRVAAVAVQRDDRPAGREELAALGRDGALRRQVRIVGLEDDQKDKQARDEQRRAEPLKRSARQRPSASPASATDPSAPRGLRRPGSAGRCA